MITVPLDVQCNFCIKIFCCLKCRINHEKNVHQDEINKKIRDEYIKSICFVCRGEEFPIKINEVISAELIQHLSEHFPLKCSKCSKIFENINDFQQIGKCCSFIQVFENEEIITEDMGENLIAENEKVDINGNDKALTPLTKINLRWRRKSREFLHKSQDTSHVKHEEQIPENQLKRQTSTPMQGNFDSLSSIQFSSINCVSSSSEHDLSPPLLSKQPVVVPMSPKSDKVKGRSSPHNKSRAKVAVRNTPLRQVMTKSIQRAMATHGHYKHIHLQQRKMTFDSSSSSNEPTVSLMKLHIEAEELEKSCQPLDLRLSPALRRNTEEDDVIIAEENVKHVEYEEIQVIVRQRSSDISSLSSYKSCSDIETPKVSSTNILKKTISFEATGMNDATPGFLIPRDNDDSDIFYTPKAMTPVNRVKSLDITDNNEIHDHTEKNTKVVKNSSSNIWNYVTSVMGSLVTGATKHDQNHPASLESKSKWGFNFEKPLKAAVSYFGKYSDKIEENDSKSSEDDEDAPSQKRSRATITSPVEESKNIVSSSVITSPICKRRKIQGRKPIERMRLL